MPIASVSTRSGSRAAIVALALSLASPGCERPTAPLGAVVSVTLSRASAILATAGHVQLTATARTAAGIAVPSANIQWSSDSQVATVSSEGVVTGALPGRGTIKATAGSITAEATVQVVNATPASLVVVPSTPTLSVGQVIHAQAVEFDPDGVGVVASGVTWATSQTAVASVNAFGLLTAAGSGKATITATVNGRSTTAGVSVVAFKSIAATGVSEGIGPSDSRPELVPDPKSKTAICAVTNTDQLYCAGKSYGPMAVPVAPTRGFTSVVSGGWNAFCALASGGAPYCWIIGRDPEPVPTLQRFASIASAGADKDGTVSGCGLAVEGSVYCWGAGGGRIGNGSFAPSPVPVAVTTSETFAEIVTNQTSTCARTSLGKIYCWGGTNLAGRSNFGVLGTGNSTDSSATPIPIQSVLMYSRIMSAGARSTCAIAADTQKLYCWGDMGTQAQFASGVCGPSSEPCSTAPTAIPTDFRFTAFAPVQGPGFAAGQCAVTANGALACWGVSYWGADQFGVESRTLPMCGLYPCLRQPTVTISDAGFTNLFGTAGNLCAIDISARALCWGPNVAGQLTDSTVSVGTPKPTVFSIDPSR